MAVIRLKYFWFTFIFLFSIGLHSQTDSTKKNNLSFDLGITRGHNINLWPFFKKYKNAEKKELQILYPFFSSKRNFVLKTKHSHFIPFYVHDSSKAGTDTRILSFYYPSVLHFHKQVDSTGTSRSFKFLELAPHISLMGFSKSPGGLSVENNIFFFIWYRKDVLQQKTRLVVFPAYWYFANKRDTTRFLFPVYFKRDKPGSEYLNVLGIYNQRNTLFEKKKSLFPLWWHSENYSPLDTVKRNVFFPLYWSTKSRNEDRTLFFPISYSSRTKDYRSFTLFPLYSSGHRTDSTSSYRAITPFLWHVKNRYGVTNTFFPLFWHTERYYRKDTVKRNVLFPLVWTTRSRDLNSSIYFPLVFSFNDKERKSFTFFPLFSYGGMKDSSSSYLAVTPLFWHFKNKYSTKNIFFPVYWNIREIYKGDTMRREIIFPFYWTYRSKDENNNVVFPFLYSYKNKDRTALTILPLFSYSNNHTYKRGHLVITPFYWKRWDKWSERQTVFPIYWSKKEFYRNDTVTKRVLFPLYWSSRSNSSSSDVVFPFIWSFKDKYYKSFTFFPFFSTGHSMDSSGSKHLAVTPFYWKFEDKYGTRKFVFPFYWGKKSYYNEDTIYRRVVFPVYWSAKSSKKQNTIVFPFVYNLKNKERHSLTVFPFFSYGHHYRDSARKYYAITPFFWHHEKQNKVSNVLFPVYWNTAKYYNHDTVRREVIFPLLWTRKSKNRSDLVFFPLVFNHKDKYKQSFTFFPFFSAGHRYDSNSSYFAITPLYWHLEDRNSLTDFLLPIFFRHKYYGSYDTSVRTVLFPVYWSYYDKDKQNSVLFPFVYNLNNKYRKSLTVFPLFSYGYSKKDAFKKHLVVTPLFWHIRNKHHGRDVLFPLYWQHKEYKKDDTTVRRFFFPLYWHYKSKTESNSMVFPLVYNFKNKYKHSFTFIPIVSYGRRFDSTGHLAVTPLFWHIKNKYGKRNILFPLYWGRTSYTKDDTLKSNIVFPLYWSYKSKKERMKLLFPIIFSKRDTAYKSFTFIPLFSTGHGINNGKKHLMITPFFGRFSSEKSSNTFLFPLFNHRRDSVERHFSALLFLYRQTKREDYTRTSFLWPICEYEREKEKKHFRFAPIVWFSKTDTSKMFSIQPLFYNYKTANRKIFILSAFLYKRDNQIGKSVSNAFLWRLFYAKKYANGDYERRFLHLVIANVKVDGHREKAFLPFFHTVKEANGDKSKSYFFGMYNRFKEYKPEIKDFYEEERIFWFIRLRSNYKQLQNEGKGGFVRKRQGRRGNK